jgi:hypothetical protein
MAIQSVQNLKFFTRVVALEKYSQAMCEESQKAKIFLEMASAIYKAGTAALNQKDFLGALQAYHDCYRPIQECIRLTRSVVEDKDIWKEVHVIEKDVQFHMASAEAMQAIKLGMCHDSLLQLLCWILRQLP